MFQLTSNLTIFLSAIFNFLTLCSSYRILTVFPMPSRSHYALGSSLTKGLAEAGNDVTFLTPISDEKLFKGNGGKGSLREIYLDGLLELMEEHIGEVTDKKDNYLHTPFSMLSMMNLMTAEMADRTLRHPKVQQLINSDEKFDAVIVTEFMVDALKGFSAHFDAHLMGFCNHGGMTWSHQYMGASTLPSFYPNVMMGFPERMGFAQRGANLLISLFMKFNEVFFVLPMQNEIHSRYFPNNPDLRTVLSNVSLTLFNSQTGSLFFALPRVPIMIDVGGLHIKPAKTLPDDLKKIMDDAKDGVIYFSMGSTFKSESLPPEAFEAMLKVFSKRKEKILFKYGYDDLTNKPDNVQLGKWFPQQEILAHPNLKVFVSHGGMLSTTEAIHHGVPIVALPVMADQKMNARLASQGGFGITMDIGKLTEETFGKALNDVISIPSYRETARQKSAVFRDRRHEPIDEAVYWIEYVIRHKGAKHLRVAYADMLWYQYFLLDVIAVVIGSIWLVLFLIKKSLCFLVRKFRKNNESPKAGKSGKKVNRA